MHVHITTAGKSLEPVKKAFNALPGIDKVYILYSEKFEEEANKLESFVKDGMAEPHLIKVSGFDFQEIVNAIYNIYNAEYGKRTHYSINITGGTNLMAAAACSCAFFIGATIYYVLYDPELSLSEQLVEIPTPRTPNVEKLGAKTRGILKYIVNENCAGRIVTNKGISVHFDVDKQNTSYHLRRLEGEGLITISHGCTIDNKTDRRMSVIGLTNQGKLIGNWIGD